MTIKYLDSKRIRGSKQATHTDPVVIGGTSGTGSAFADGTQYNSEDDTLTYDIRRGNIYGLANVSNDGGDGAERNKWGLRFKLTIDSIVTNSSTPTYIGIGMSSSYGHYGAGQNQISLMMKFSSSSSDTDFRTSGGRSTPTSENSEVGSNMLATGTWYVTVERRDNTTARVTVTTNSDYGTSSTYEDKSIDGNTGNEDVQYIKYFFVKNVVGSTVDNHVYFKVEDVKLWNGTNTYSGTPTTTIDMSHNIIGWNKSPASSNVGNGRINFLPTAVHEKSTLVTAAPWTKEGTQTNVTGGLVEVRNEAQNTSGISYPLGLTVDGDFVLRFKFMQNAASGGNGDVVALTDTTIHHDAQEVIDLALYNGYFYLIAKTGGSVIQSSGGQSNGSDQDTDMNPVDGTQYYAELKRSGNVYTATVRTGSHSGSVFERVLTFTKTSGNHATPNKIFIGAQRDSQAKSIDVDDIEFWDDTDSTSGSATYTQDFSTAVATPTSDLPENTLFEEVDTKQTYWLQSNVWERRWQYVTPTIDDDFSTDNYVNAGTNIEVKTSGGSTAGGSDGKNLYFKILRHNGSNSGNDACYRDIGSDISNTTWTLRFKMHIVDLATGSSSHKKSFIGFTNNTSHTPWNFWSENNHNHIGFSQQVSDNSSERRHYMSWGDNETYPSNETLMTTEVVEGTTKWYEIKRTSATNFTITIFSDEDYSTVLETKDQTITAGDGENMRYFIITNDTSNNQAGTIEGYIEDWKFYDGELL